MQADRLTKWDYKRSALSVAAEDSFHHGNARHEHLRVDKGVLYSYWHGPHHTTVHNNVIVRKP